MTERIYQEKEEKKKEKREKAPRNNKVSTRIKRTLSDSVLMTKDAPGNREKLVLLLRFVFFYSFLLLAESKIHILKNNSFNKALTKPPLGSK